MVADHLPGLLGSRLVHEVEAVAGPLETPEGHLDPRLDQLVFESFGLGGQRVPARGDDERGGNDRSRSSVA